ncbi:LAMI_0E06194g1_1 [Lachancea mirantina]|uniref:LAMI_0E06194g1_1 n=1 Tax=Lachancea mirantina TaxID=1230905 RepID=A0A1G4JLQ5_9SACH|nr:LAMI_0E06194g1_1 [Lachancea mirantina]
MSRIQELSASDVEEGYSSKQGQVYLGFVDATIKQTDSISIEDTFIGGEPLWLHPDSKPSVDLLKCGACKSSDSMKLLLQAFAPLDEEQVEETAEKLNLTQFSSKWINANDDRVLYIFMCSKCRRRANTVRCVRGVKKAKVSTSASDISAKLTQVPAGKNFDINPFDLQKSAQNPFATPSLSGSTNPFANAAENPFQMPKTELKKPLKQEASAKTIRKEHDAKPDKNFDSKTAFPGYFLFVEEESFKNKTPDHLKLPKNLKIDESALDATVGDDSAMEKSPIKLDPRTEKLSKFLDDDIFQKFQEIAGYNPLQVLRYDFGGKPLYYAQTSVNIENTIPSPSYNPSSARVFELQLMPKMILDLEHDVSVEEGMDWGTIFIFSDIENYTPDFDEHGVCYVEETARVQWEAES